MQEQLPRGALKQNPFILWFLVAGLTAIPACDAKEPATQSIPPAPSPYSVIDSGVWADWGGLPNFYWLDNNRLIFTGTEAKGKANAVLRRQIQLWDTKTNTVTLYASTTTGIVCYNDGTILYAVGKDGEDNETLKYGKLNKETTVIKQKKGKMYFDTVNCRVHENHENAPGRKERRIIKLLFERHGYLDYGSITEVRNLSPETGKPILYYRAGSGEPISLPITTAGYRNIDYYEFKNAYYVHFFTGYHHAWWLYPDGSTELVKFQKVPDVLSRLR